MPERYESIPPEQELAYLRNAERAANEAGRQVVDPRIPELGHAVVRAVEEAPVMRVLDDPIDGRGTFDGVGFKQWKATMDHNATWNMATGTTLKSPSHPARERFPR